jgi:rubrerythrin
MGYYGADNDRKIGGSPELMEVKAMADWVCKKCGYVRDSRCKPKKCPSCDAPNSFDKKEETKKS